MLLLLFLSVACEWRSILHCTYNMNISFIVNYRACRLKKKAQHEANKVKLQGLEMEQSELFCRE